MSTIKRMVAAVALAGAAGSVATLAAAGPAAAMPRGPQVVSNRLTAVKANTTSWVNIYWRTDRPVCNAQVAVDGGRQVRVSYPGLRHTTTFTTGTSLRPGRTAATPIRVSPVSRTSSVVVLRASMSYTDCDRHARTQWTRVDLTLPVIRQVIGQPGVHFPGAHLPGNHMPGAHLPGNHMPVGHLPGHPQPGDHRPGHN
jgi:hypothetical protein